MKKSFMNNLRNFVDSNVLHRIDKATNNSGNINGTDLLNDDLLSIERHFDDLHQFCIDAEKKISNLLQSIHVASIAPSQLGAYTHNVQAGLNNLSHNLAQQAASITSSSYSTNNPQVKGTESNDRNSFSPAQESTSSNSNRQSPCDRSTIATRKQQDLPTQPLNISDPYSLTGLNYDILDKHKKLPVVKFYKTLCKSCEKIKQDSLLATTLNYCSRMQARLTNLYLVHEQMIDTHCLSPIHQMLEVDIPNVSKLRKLYIKAHNDLESARNKFNIASQKQHQQMLQSGQSNHSSYLVTQNSNQQSSMNKLDSLRNELDESVTRFDQAKDIYEAELYAFVCREPELVNLLKRFYQLESSYHQQAVSIIQDSLPAVDIALDRTPKKFVFGTPLTEHVRCTGRQISPVIELCIHFLHSQGLDEEGLFRVPGSSVKIKKLKNGINASFLTLKSLTELESDQQRESGHSCITTLYELFKSAVGHPPYREHLFDLPALQSNLLRNTLAIDDSSMSGTNFSKSQAHEHESRQDNVNDEYIMDVHSIAGLLKLYLRELPEPLFTHDLYDDWISCASSRYETIDQRLDSLGKVLRQLPSDNYANLKHLIKFLHKLTQHQELNKMTSTNLAIAMAPSLIWPKPLDEQHERDDTVLASVNSQMSSFGLSTSQHAVILDALINNADVLFPESVDYELSEFSHLTLRATSSHCLSTKREGRTAKSTSPTGLSTASSSSFSSNASNPAVSASLNKGHSRKGGSMEGLLGGNVVLAQSIKCVPDINKSTRSVGRPMSVQVGREEYSKMRLNHANTPEPNSTSAKTVAIANPVVRKPMAPPVPPPTSIRHQQERLKLSATIQTKPESDEPIARGPKPVSLRGTGIQDRPLSSNTVHGNVRPSVPPPERPLSASVIESSNEDHVKSKSIERIAMPIESKPSESIRDNLEKIEICEADEMRNSFGAKFVNDQSLQDDSSFEDIEDNRDSSSQCPEDDTHMSEVKIPSDNVADLIANSDVKFKEKTSLQRRDNGDDQKLAKCSEPTRPKPPTKPPRSSSPKIKHTTPL